MKYLSLKIPGPDGGYYEIDSVGGLPSGKLNFFDNLLSSAITILLISAVIITLFILIWGGIMWITSGGDKAKVEAARNRIVYSIIGLIVVFSSFFIVNIVFQILGVSFSLR